MKTPEIQFLDLNQKTITYKPWMAKRRHLPKDHAALIYQALHLCRWHTMAYLFKFWIEEIDDSWNVYVRDEIFKPMFPELKNNIHEVLHPNRFLGLQPYEVQKKSLIPFFQTFIDFIKYGDLAEWFMTTIRENKSIKDDSIPNWDGLKKSLDELMKEQFNDISLLYATIEDAIKIMFLEDSDIEFEEVRPHMWLSTFIMDTHNAFGCAHMELKYPDKPFFCDAPIDWIGLAQIFQDFPANPNEEQSYRCSFWAEGSTHPGLYEAFVIFHVSIFDTSVVGAGWHRNQQRTILECMKKGIVYVNDQNHRFNPYRQETRIDLRTYLIAVNSHSQEFRDSEKCKHEIVSTPIENERY